MKNYVFCVVKKNKKMKITTLIIALIFLFGCSNSVKQEQSTAVKNEKLTDLVNPLMGTDSNYALSNGNTYPAIARP